MKITLWSEVFKKLISVDELATTKLAYALLSDRDQMKWWTYSSAKLGMDCGLVWPRLLAFNQWWIDWYRWNKVPMTLAKENLKHAYEEWKTNNME